ncbi:MAG: rhodanese-like domain-containing protein [Candidatus Paceibacterota bacterium]
MSETKNSLRGKTFAGFGAVALVAALLFLVSSFSGPSSGYNTTLGSQEFISRYRATPNAELVDVRTPAEFDSGHIAGAVDIDFEGPGFEAAVKALDRSKTYFVYCHSGNRSGKATAVMRQEGIAHIYQLQGGVASASALVR